MGGGRTTLNDPVVMVLIAGAALALLLGLGWSPLFLYDESLYCGVTADMDQHQQWLYATDDGEFFGWYGKPPLINWLQKLSTTIFGWSIWALRLPTALGMLALIGLVIKTGSWLGGRDLGLLSGAAVLLSARMVHTGRHILLEDLVVPLFAAALLLWAIALEEQQRRQKPHWLALVGAGLTVAAAILTKQAFAAFAPAAIVASELFLRRPGWWLRPAVIGVIALAGSAWWFALTYAEVGPPFIDSMVGYHIQARFSEVLEAHPRGLNDYVASLDDHLQVLPWALGAFGWALLWPKLKNDGPQALFVAWCVLAVLEYLVVGVAIKTFLPWYQLTLMLPLFVGAAHLVIELWTLDSPLRWTGPIVFAAAAFTSARVDAFAAMLLGAPVGWWLFQRVRGRHREPVLVGLVIVLGIVVANPFHGRDGRYRIAQRVREHAPRHASVTVVGDAWRRVWMCYAPQATRLEWSGQCPPAPSKGWLILDGDSARCAYPSAALVYSGRASRGDVKLYRIE